MNDIETLIEKLSAWDETPQLEPLPMLAKAHVLAVLYQARALERLEATVRMIGVQFFEAIDPPKKKDSHAH